MKNNFFRKDLKLGSRWWHRLFLVIFFVSSVWALYATYDNLFSTNHPYIPQWKVVNSVEERITPAVKQIRELKTSNERVEELDRSYALNSQKDDSLYDDIYCSSDLENRIVDVQNKSGISTLYIRDIYQGNNVPIETFANYIKENNINCLIPDAYTRYDSNGRENGKLRFLEPIAPDSLFYKNLVFYEKSDFLTALYTLKMFLLVIAIFTVIIVLYYKVFLYIIFGSKKIDNNKESKKL
ncbi:MAG: hypothetical protein ABID45_01670 [Patescibacteria group bacterium]